MHNTSLARESLAGSTRTPNNALAAPDANPVDPAWEAYCHHRDRHLTRHASSSGRAKVLCQQTGRCPVCRQVIQGEEVLDRPHRDGHHRHHQLANLVFRHPTCHRKEHAKVAAWVYPSCVA